MQCGDGRTVETQLTRGWTVVQPRMNCVCALSSLSGCIANRQRHLMIVDDIMTCFCVSLNLGRLSTHLALSKRLKAGSMLTSDRCLEPHPHLDMHRTLSDQLSVTPKLSHISRSKVMRNDLQTTQVKGVEVEEVINKSNTTSPRNGVPRMPIKSRNFREPRIRGPRYNLASSKAQTTFQSQHI